ncbi:hypothetical protein LINPERPRIM_LOCUS39572, partial [Linum perenne]
ANSQPQEAVRTFFHHFRLVSSPILHQIEEFTAMSNSDPKYAYPYPAQQGYYQGPPVMPPPQYAAAPPPRRQAGFLEGW